MDGKNGRRLHFHFSQAAHKHRHFQADVVRQSEIPARTKISLQRFSLSEIRRRVTAESCSAATLYLLFGKSKRPALESHIIGSTVIVCAHNILHSRGRETLLIEIMTMTA